MGKKLRRKHPLKYTDNSLKIAERAMEKIAAREGVSVDHVRKHIQLAMLSGLMNQDPSAQGA